MTLNRFMTAVTVLAAVVALGTPRSQAQVYNTTWSDEFNGAYGSPNTTNWSMETGNNNGWGNNELEYYCPYGNNTYPCSSSNPNVYQDGNGHLVISAFPVGSTYTSARILSYPNGTTQYGLIEARMQIPYGDGLWPAFWMLGNSIMTGTAWPACGEIDIMENVPQMGDTTIQSSLHGANGFNTGNQTGVSSPINSAFHIYGVNWYPQTVQFFVDDYTHPFVTLTASSSGGTWEFDNGNFFLLFNLAVGGDWPDPGPDSSTSWPANMTVDYVRVRKYQAGAGSINSGAWYQIINQNSGSCMDDTNSGTSDGTTVQQWQCGVDQYNQEWQLIPTSNGYYRIVNRNSGLVLDDTNWSTTPGTGLQQWSYGGGANQQWIPQQVGASFQLVNLYSGLCLDVPGASTQNGVQLDQYTCNGTGAQMFQLLQEPN
jgi:beta-glucanase (GH16 family)